MDSVLINIPDGNGQQVVDEATLKEALAALSAKKAQQARAKERREKMTEEEKLAQAQAAKRRRTAILLKVKYAETNGYEPTEAEIDAYIAGNGEA